MVNKKHRKIEKKMEKKKTLKRNMKIDFKKKVSDTVLRFPNHKKKKIKQKK